MESLKRIIRYLAALSAAALTLSGWLSCVRLAPADDPCEEVDSAEVAFVAEDGGMEGLLPETKVSEVTSLTGTGMYVSAVRGNPGSETAVFTSQPFTWDGNYFTGGQYWPASGNPYTAFYAANNAINFNAGGSYIDVVADKDYVCAYKGNPRYGKVNKLEFHHILARVGTVTVSAVGGYDVEGFEMLVANVMNKGRYNLRTGAWTLKEHATSVTPNRDGLVMISGAAGGISVNQGFSATGSSNGVWLVPGEYELVFWWTEKRNGFREPKGQKEVFVTLPAGKVTDIHVDIAGGGTRAYVWLGIGTLEGYIPENGTW
jgi:hypothetical protein